METFTVPEQLYNVLFTIVNYLKDFILSLFEVV